MELRRTSNYRPVERKMQKFVTIGTKTTLIIRVKTGFEKFWDNVNIDQ